MADRPLGPWLALREPLDAAARSGRLTRLIADALGHDDPLFALDLASGTASNIRYLMNRLLARDQRWLAVDVSTTLLAEMQLRLSSWGTALGYDVANDAA